MKQLKQIRTAAAAVLGAGALAMGVLVPPLAGASQDTASRVEVHPAATTAAAQQAVRDYWTPERMKSAIPRDVAIKAVPTARPSTVTSKAVQVAPQPQLGKVFFTLDGVNYVCSGTATVSGNEDVVTTAGHCLNEGPGAYATYFAFVPGYENGKRPYGTWVARALMTTSAWRTSGDLDHDLGFAVMGEQGGLSLLDRTGAYPIAFDLANRLYYDAYGYPAAKPFNGQYLYRCSGWSGVDALLSDDHSLPCNMTGGSSGGGWITSGQLNSVNSFKYTIDKNTMYGPQFSTDEKAAYTVASTS